jgi:hypothetical protein
MTWPNVVSNGLLSGALNCERLKRLSASMRTSKVIPSRNRKSRRRLAFHWFSPSARTEVMFSGNILLTGAEQASLD